MRRQENIIILSSGLKLLDPTNLKVLILFWNTKVMVSNMVTAILSLIRLQLAFIDLDRLSGLGLSYEWRQSSDPADVDSDDSIITLPKCRKILFLYVANYRKPILLLETVIRMLLLCGQHNNLILILPSLYIGLFTTCIAMRHLRSCVMVL